MKTIGELTSNETLNEDLDTIYDGLIVNLQKAKANKQPIDEGLFGALFGGIAGATAGPAVMKTLCNVLGVDERGTLGSLFTSRLVLAAMGAKLGWKM